MSRDVAVMSRSARYLQDISIGQYRIQADEPVEAGGGDAGPNPHELLLAALGACTSMTLRMYADRSVVIVRGEANLLSLNIHISCIRRRSVLTEESGFVQGAFSKAVDPWSAEQL